MENIKIKKLLELAANETSEFEKQALWRKENKSWLQKSAAISVKVLLALKEQGISQKVLAERLDVSPQHVSKIVKGKENLSLETIVKLESALSIKIVEVAGNHTLLDYVIPAYFTKESVLFSNGISKVIPLPVNNYSMSESEKKVGVA